MFCYANDTTCLSPSTGTAQQTFSAALQFFAAATCFTTDNWPPNADINEFETFDFIIVGAGTAGSVVANRLSENKKWKILLIEAGHIPPIESKIPAQDKAMFNSEYDWRYRTTFNGKTNKANKNKYINWPRGKMLGGSSNINAMLYVKGNRHDYQRWYDAGNKEWHPDTVFKYFKKAENLQSSVLLDQSDIRDNYGRKGLLPIQRFNSTYRPLTLDILGAMHELGIKNVPDLNTANVLGSGIITVTAHNGIRASSDRIYLLPVQNRTNLKILTGTLVTKVLIKESNKTAYGVEIERNGIKINITANREVILCAGTINTAHLLLLSGIGPNEDLKSKGIQCIADLPVGRYLQDHCSIPVPIAGDGPREKTLAERSYDTVTYLYNQTGDLAQNSFADILAFYAREKNATYPEFQNHVSIFWKNSSTIQRGFSNVFNYEDSIVQHLAAINKNNTIYTFLFNLLHPHSMGNITLNSTDPKDPPIIYANYFDNPLDLEAAVAGLKTISKIRHTEFFKSINGSLVRMNWPLCNEFELDGDEYWKCVCINMVFTVYHPVGTARMGPDPSNSVVDSRLRVHKVKNLRVIDASVMPNLTSGNTNGPCFMIGERGSDLVKEDHKNT